MSKAADFAKAYRVEDGKTKKRALDVVPADNKWFTRLVVAAAVIGTLEKLDLHYPKVDDAKKKELEAARAILEGPRDPSEVKEKRDSKG